MTIPLIYRGNVAEIFQVKRTERMYDCHISKNLWNQAQYIVDGEYRKSGETPDYQYVWSKLSDRNYYEDNPDFDNYHKLPPATSEQILKVHN